MNCLIVDDNKIARTVLKHLVSGINFLQVVGECENIVEAGNVLNREKVDLLLLDVEMPKVSGLEFLKAKPDHPLVILITSKPDYALEAFEYNVVDFLLKPVKEERFLKAIYRAKETLDSKQHWMEMEKDFFFIKEKGKSTKVNINDILYLQALGDYVCIFCPQKKFTIHYTLSAIEKLLPPSKFMRIHRSYMVALNKIDSFEDGTVYVNQNAIPIGESQKSNLLKQLNLL
jgi:DNA-binding LytR/AlgR family response regulator